MTGIIKEANQVVPIEKLELLKYNDVYTRIEDVQGIYPEEKSTIITHTRG